VTRLILVCDTTPYMQKHTYRNCLMWHRQQRREWRDSFFLMSCVTFLIYTKSCLTHARDTTYLQAYAYIQILYEVVQAVRHDLFTPVTSVIFPCFILTNAPFMSVTRLIYIHTHTHRNRLRWRRRLRRVRRDSFMRVTRLAYMHTHTYRYCRKWR